MEKYYNISMLLYNSETEQESDGDHQLVADSKEDAITKFEAMLKKEAKKNDLQLAITKNSYAFANGEVEYRISNVDAHEVTINISCDLDISDEPIIQAKRMILKRWVYWSDGQGKHVAWDFKLTDTLWVTDIEANNELTCIYANIIE